MKKMKISIVALFAVFIALGLSAFTIHPKPTRPLADEWFIYKGTGSKSQAGSYTYSAGGSDPMCPNTNVLCAIKVASDGSGHIVQSALTSFASNPGFSQPVAGKVEFRDN